MSFPETAGSALKTQKGFGIQIATAVVAGIIESFMARFRMGHNSQFILVLSSLALLMLLGVMLIIN